MLPCLILGPSVLSIAIRDRWSLRSARRERTRDFIAHLGARESAGDILLLPHGSAHLTRGRIGVGHASPPIAIEYRNGVRRKTSMGVAVTTELICGRLHFEQAAEGLLIAALPEVVVVSTENRLVTDRFCGCAASASGICCSRGQVP
jgi:hypothetical protein